MVNSYTFLALFLLQHVYNLHFTRADLYTKINGEYCLKRLNLTGHFGCKGHYKGNTGTIIQLKSHSDFDQSLIKKQSKSSGVILIIPSHLLTTDFINKLSGLKYIKGVATLHSKFDKTDYSHASNSPLNNIRPSVINYFEWNPTGDDFARQVIPFPLFQLSKESSIFLLTKLNQLEKDEYYKMTLKSTKLAQTNSRQCLIERTCNPIGGYSIMAMYSRLKISKTKFVIITAPMSGENIFNGNQRVDRTNIAGLTVLLTIAKTIQDDLKQFHNKIYNVSEISLIYVALNMEEYENMGSKMFVKYLNEFDCKKRYTFLCDSYFKNSMDTLGKINSENIIGVIGLEQLNGFGPNREFNEQFVAFVPDNIEEDSIINQIAKSIEDSAEKSQPDKIQFSIVKTNNIPPSSVWTFIEYKNEFPNMDLMVLSDHETAYKNKNYQSPSDIKINKIYIKKVATFILNSLLKNIWNIENPIVDVKLSSLESILYCLQSSDCENSFGDKMNDIKLTKNLNRTFDIFKSTQIEEIVTNLMKDSTKLSLNNFEVNIAKDCFRVKNNVTIYSEYCKIDDFLINRNSLWCGLLGKTELKFDENCYFSAVYNIPSYSFGYNFSVESNRWILSKDKKVLMGNMFAQSMSFNEIAVIFKEEKRFIQWVLFGIGIILFLTAIGVYFFLKKTRLVKIKRY